MSSDNKPKGLPGFLRRSLRLTEEDEAEAKLDDVSNSSTEGRARISNNSMPSPKPPRQNKTPTGTPMATPAPTPIATKRTTAGMPDIPTLALEKTAFSNSTKKGSWADDNGATRPKSESKRNVSYKERQFDTTIQSDVVNMADLRQFGWNGISSEHRPMAWKLLLGYLPTNSARRQQTLLRKRAEYRDAIAQHYDIDDDTRTMQEQETLRQVLVDVPRTAPEVGLFRDDRIKKALSRLLYIWACRHPASSYVQGINDLATPLVVVFLQECGVQGANLNSSILDGSIMSQVSDSEIDEVSFCIFLAMLVLYTKAWHVLLVYGDLL
jgi:hypothetical protein